MKLMVQIEDEAHKLEVMQDPVFINTFKRFISALQSVLPQLPLSEMIWRFKFMIFSMHAIMVWHPIPSDSEFNEKRKVSTKL